VSDFPVIEYALKTIFTVEAGLSEDAAIRMYVRSTANRAGRLKEELRQAFGRSDISWKALLRNESYEVYDAETEAEAMAFAKRILLDPLQ